MFDNIGRKIKTIAAVMGLVGGLASVIRGGMILFAGDNAETIITGLLVLLLGSLASWGVSLLVYGFGQLIENSNQTVRKLHGLEVQVRMLREANPPAMPAAPVRQQSAPAAMPDAPVRVPPAVVKPAPARPEDKWKCPACGAWNRGSVFCSGCGKYRGK